MFRLAGRGLAAPNAGPADPALKPSAYGITTPEEARRAVREQLAHKVDFVKVWVDDRNHTVQKLSPELYRAAIVQVGVLDMLRFNRFGQGAGWEGDYGSPQDSSEFRALYAYSPVHNVHRGTRYPATLVVTGDHDTRVMPMHSFKFAAALQAAQAGAAPVLLAVALSSGHRGGETVTQAIDQEADIYAFLANNLGMLPNGH